jgi:hypothetical protein
MRATLNLPDPLINDLLKVSGEKKKTKAICLAIELGDHGGSPLHFLVTRKLAIPQI